MRSNLQLVGVTCLFIASKYEEIYAPQVTLRVHSVGISCVSGSLRAIKTADGNSVTCQQNQLSPYNM